MNDIIKTSIPESDKDKTDVYLRKLYTYIKDNRDELGYPCGTNITPYLYVSNDLCGKYFQMMQLFISKRIQFDVTTCIDILKSLIDTYDHEHNTENGHKCCSFYHSKSKEEMQVLYSKLTQQG